MEKIIIHIDDSEKSIKDCELIKKCIQEKSSQDDFITFIKMIHENEDFTKAPKLHKSIVSDIIFYTLSEQITELLAIKEIRECMKEDKILIAEAKKRCASQEEVYISAILENQDPMFSPSNNRLQLTLQEMSSKSRNSIIPGMN